jgi:hypothetical protein
VSESSSEEYTDNEEDIGVDFEWKIPTNTWIIKPGENSNRGNGIVVCKTLREIETHVCSGVHSAG